MGPEWPEVEGKADIEPGSMRDEGLSPSPVRVVRLESEVAGDAAKDVQHGRPALQRAGNCDD